MGAIARAQDVAQSVIGRLARVGADPSDDEDTHSGKALLVLISSLILPIAFLWGVLYLAFGPPAGIVPLVYFAVLLAALGAFARTRSSCSATS